MKIFVVILMLSISSVARSSEGVELVIEFLDQYGGYLLGEEPEPEATANNFAKVINNVKNQYYKNLFAQNLQQLLLEHELIRQQNVCNQVPGKCEDYEKLKVVYKKNYGQDFSLKKLKLNDLISEIKQQNPEVLHKSGYYNFVYPKKFKLKPNQVKPEQKNTSDNTVDEKIKKDYKRPSYISSTCEWVEDIPRRVVMGPGCNSKNTKLCVGHVACERKDGGGKFIRVSTCSASNCGDNEASKCTSESGYSSKKPEDEENEDLSTEVEQSISNKVRAEQ
jgi:hypothetical protein